MWCVGACVGGGISYKDARGREHATGKKHVPSGNLHVASQAGAHREREWELGR